MTTPILRTVSLGAKKELKVVVKTPIVTHQATLPQPVPVDHFVDAGKQTIVRAVIKNITLYPKTK